jgi:hypothetical protein
MGACFSLPVHRSIGKHRDVSKSLAMASAPKILE